MMLEYLLVRPADREAIFANHRCRFLVLDEVHTYRGILGSNIALLVRRLKVHLARAKQDWKPDVPDNERAKRYSSLVLVGTSATIKTVAEEGLSSEERIRQRDQAVQEFFATLTGVEPGTIRVFGEKLENIKIPAEATYPKKPGAVAIRSLDVSNAEAVRQALCRLAGLPADAPIDTAARRSRLLWDLNRWLIGRPMSASQMVAQVKAEVPERKDTPEDQLRAEVEAGLVIGAALPDGTPGALRLRAHRFIRGGWQFHRCVNPDCGRLYPMGEEKCSVCHYDTAPLYLCRNCGADYLRLVGDLESPTLRPSARPDDGPEWMVYEPGRFESAGFDDEDEDENGNGAVPSRRRSQKMPAQIKRRPLLEGSFDPQNLQFSANPEDYRVRVTLVNLGLACVAYDRLDEYVRACGGDLAAALGIQVGQLEHLCRTVLDEIRIRGCLSREMLRFHPTNVVCPAHIQRADWERRMKQPQGYPVTPGGEPEAFLEAERVPYGIRCHNAWRKPKSGGRGPSLERLMKDLLARFGGPDPHAEQMVDLLSFLKRGSFLVPVELFGAQKRGTLLQVNEEVGRLQLVTEEIRMHCDVCGAVLSGASAGLPCPECHGTLVRWLDREVHANRAVKRIKKPQTIPLVAKEHTAQITTDDRIDYETAFKAPAAESKVNVLA
jgi:hypothetical protein